MNVAPPDGAATHTLSQRSLRQCINTTFLPRDLLYRRLLAQTSQVSRIVCETHTFVGHLMLTRMQSHTTSVFSTAQCLSLVRSRKSA